MAAQDRFQGVGGRGAILLHRESWQTLRGKESGFRQAPELLSLFQHWSSQRRVYSKGEGKKKTEKLLVRETAAASRTFKDKFKGGRFVTPTDQPPC